MTFATTVVVAFADAEEVAEAAEEAAEETAGDAGSDATYNADVAMGMLGHCIGQVLLDVPAFHTAHRALPEINLKQQKLIVTF